MGVSETPDKLRYFQGLLKTYGNPLATLALPRESQTPSKTISGVKTPRNTKYNPR